MPEIQNPNNATNYAVQFSSIEIDYETTFEEADGLTIHQTFNESTSKGEFPYSQMEPQIVEQENIILKRGLLKGEHLKKWLEKATETTDDPVKVVISTANDPNTPDISWELNNVRPVRAETTFEEQGNDKVLVVDLLEITFDTINLVAE